MPDQHPDDNGCQCFEKGYTEHAGSCLYEQPQSRGTAVEVWRVELYMGNPLYSETPSDEMLPHAEAGVWRPQAEDALLLGVVEAARKVHDEFESWVNTEADVHRAFAALGAALDAWRPTDG